MIIATVILIFLLFVYLIWWALSIPDNPPPDWQVRRMMRQQSKYMEQDTDE